MLFAWLYSFLRTHNQYIIVHDSLGKTSGRKAQEREEEIIKREDGRENSIGFVRLYVVIYQMMWHLYRLHSQSLY
jgi:hypothetical protein